MKYLLISLVISAYFVNGQEYAEVPDWPICDPELVTWHRHPYACTRYVLCFHGNPIERLCAPGLHFSRIYEQCMFPQLAMCDINYACPDEDDEFNPVFLPHEDDCSSYFVCFRGNVIPRDCATGFWWDVVYNWCTIPEEVNCDSRVSNDPRPPSTTETPMPTDPPTEPENTQPPTTQPPPPVTTQDPNTYDCPLGSNPTFHPHSRECELYFICINGMAFLRQCAPEMLFDIVNRECNEREKATCISGTSNGLELNEVNLMPTEFVCPLHFDYDILLFPHQSSCERYYVCEKGVAYLHKCSNGKSYDIKTEKCEEPVIAICLNNL